VAAAHTSWTVLRHGPIVELAENLWRVEGAIPGFALVDRAMTVVRLGDGRLVIHNAIALDAPSMGRLEAWGRPAVMIVPNGWHRLDARAYRDRYPDLRVACPSGARKRVSEVVDVDCGYEDLALGDDAVTVRYLDGVAPAEGVLEIRSDDGVTVVFNDLINSLPKLRGLFGAFYGLIAGTGRPGHHRMVSRWLVRDRRAFRRELEALADRGPRRVLVSHGAVIDAHAAEVLRAVAARL
jgi:hypothetical protein